MLIVDSLLRRLNERRLFPIRTRVLTERLRPYLSGFESVLDLGSSNGKLAAAIFKGDANVRLVGCDEHVLDDAVIPITKCPGHDLPFEDGSFDCVMLVDVLHHDLQPERILAEAKRVSRGHVFVKDHYWRNRRDRIGLRVIDWIGNHPYGVKLPYNYLQLDQWRYLFAEVGLEVVKTDRFRMNKFDPCPHVNFLLRK